jgi:hypothetical protein
VVTDAVGHVLWVPGLWALAQGEVSSGHSLWAIPPSPSDGGSGPL